MNVEIWSDLVCPFCYIGKRNFEHALERFEHRDGVEVTWRSFQLDPTLPPRVDGDLHEYLGRKYGGDRASGKAMNDRVTATAAAAGLDYSLDAAVLGNTFDAHRLTHLAARHGLQDAAEERLMRAYFTESEHIADAETLVRLAGEIGLEPDEARAMLDGGGYTDAVRSDMQTAFELAITAVPTFVVERRYAISGAQPPELLLRALEQIWAQEQARDAAA